MTKVIKICLFAIFIAAFSVSAFAQTKRKPKPKTVAKKTVKKVEPTAPEPHKKNERPPEEETVADEPVQQTDPKKNNRDGKNNTRPTAKKAAFEPTYFYTFSQPNFTISEIKIEHDDKGKGKISFLKNSYEEPVTDPIQLSAVTLEKLNAILTALNFLDSTESYQYEKDYSHLGNITFKLKKDSRERETKYNYTTNKDAKNLMDEYRRIANQYIWMFDITLSRENQPLEAPGLVDVFDSYLRRNEISDPAQMIPFLKEISNDERIPLIARNHAAKIVERLEKAEKK